VQWRANRQSTAPDEGSIDCPVERKRSAPSSSGGQFDVAVLSSARRHRRQCEPWEDWRRSTAGARRGNGRSQQPQTGSDFTAAAADLGHSTTAAGRYHQLTCRRTL